MLGWSNDLYSQKGKPKIVIIQSHKMQAVIVFWSVQQSIIFTFLVLEYDSHLFKIFTRLLATGNIWFWVLVLIARPRMSTAVTC